jgi:thiol:disulfide interchange protein DsbD
MKPLIELLVPRLAAWLLVALALAGPDSAAAVTPEPQSSSFPPVKVSGDDFLPVDAAFRFGAVPSGPDRVRLVWEIADGYYLYRERVKVGIESPSASLGALEMPPGQIKNDEFFGKQEVYHHELAATMSVIRSSNAALRLPLKVTYQGCADAGLCYPPVTKTLMVSLPPGAASGAPIAGSSGASGFVSPQDSYARLVASGNLFTMLAAFFVAGLGVAFTGCVLPMVPILSGIIAGQKNVTTARAFALSLTYVLGMAFTYTAAGALSAAVFSGEQVQAAFQQPWILGLFAALFVALALSMFGLFTLQMPVAIQSRIASISNRQAAGTFGGVAIMGVLSALIVTTCVAPALIGALAVISQTGQIARGAAALFVMSLGMGTPLLVFGASQGKLLPKTGPWMETVKKLGGAMLLGAAAWMLQRIVPGPIALVLWAIPALVVAWLLLGSVRGISAGAWAGRLVGVAAGFYGAVLLVGAALGATDPLTPIPSSRAAASHELPFRTIKSVADLDREVATARAEGRTVLLDFYADWCTSCREMQKYTFTDTGVRSALRQTVLLRADVTRNDADDQALLKHFGIFGPPTIAFYGVDGTERTAYRVVGYMKPADFALRVREALKLPAALASTS